MFLKAHEVSDDTSVCFWLISMVNVSTTNTLFEVKGTESPDVKTQSGLSGFFVNYMVTRFPLCRQNFYMMLHFLTSAFLPLFVLFVFVVFR